MLPGDSVAGVQLMDAGAAGAAGAVVLIMKVALPPFREAVIVVDWLPDKLAVVATKVAEVVFAGTITDAGTVMKAAVLVTVTLVFVADALVSVIVHVVLAFAPRLVAAHCRTETAGRLAKVMLAL